MRKRSMAVVAGVVAAAFAGPGAGVAAADFVCPVLPISENAKQHAPDGRFIEIADADGDGVPDASILPGKAGDAANSPVDVGAHATNLEGAGSPQGEHATPGESGYTAIWNTP
jgi:hypothetical protein